jgi:hypothetical protein
VALIVATSLQQDEELVASLLLYEILWCARCCDTFEREATKRKVVGMLARVDARFCYDPLLVSFAIVNLFR